MKPANRRPAVIRSGVANVSPCPSCGHPLDAWIGVNIGSEEPPTPIPGDTTVCGGCATILVFADYHARVRLPTPAELSAVESDPDAYRIVRKFQEIVRKRMR